MNYLKEHKDKYQLTFAELERETGILASRLHALKECRDNAQFLHKCRVSEYKKLKKLFTELETLTF